MKKNLESLGPSLNQGSTVFLKNSTCISVLQMGMEDPTNCNCKLHQDIRGF